MAWQIIIPAAIAAASAIMGSRGASKAAASTEKAAREAAAVQRELYYQGRNDLSGYRNAGEIALANLLGTPATYAATSGDLARLVSRRTELLKQINELQTRGAAYQHEIARDRDAVGGRQFETRYKQADPGTIAQLQGQLSDLERQISITQSKMGVVTKEGTQGLLSQYPTLKEYPTMASYPTAKNFPTAGRYPTMSAMPAIDYGGGYVQGGTRPEMGTVQNAVTTAGGGKTTGTGNLGVNTGPQITGTGGTTAGAGTGTVSKLTAPTQQKAAISFSADAYEQSPGYNWQIEEAAKAVKQMAAAQGRMLSTSTIDKFARQAQGIAASDYNNWLQNQFKKADLALTQWKAGRQAAIEDWLYPYQMSAEQWQRERTASLQDWSNQRTASIQDWSNQNAANVGAWTDQYNALMRLLNSGQNAATQSAAQSQNLGSSLGNLATGVGQMNADKYINQANTYANALTSGINNALAAYNYGSQSGGVNNLLTMPASGNIGYNAYYGTYGR